MKRQKKNPLTPFFKPPKKKLEKWIVKGLDVWGCSLEEWLEEEGNTEDNYEGYQVNDWYNEGFICLSEGFSDQQLLDALIPHYIKKGATLTDINFDGDDQFISVEDAEDGRPMYHLERDEDGDDECEDEDE